MPAVTNPPRATIGPTGTKSYVPQLMMAEVIGGAFSAYQAGRARSAIAKARARIAEMQAEEARKAGQRGEAVSRQKIKKIVGKQRAALAAQGIRTTGEGSAQDIIQETQDIGELDAMTIKLNAARQAYGFATQAMGERYEAGQARREARGEMLATALAGGLRAHQYKRGGI